MKSDNDSLDSTLDRYMGQAGDPPAKQVASSVEAVWERLRPEAECAMLPARRIVTRRSHFTVAAVMVVAIVAIGLYAARHARLFEATLPVQQQTQLQVPPASHSPAVPVDPVSDRVTSGRVAESKESKEPVITSTRPAGAAGAEATLARSNSTGADSLLFAAASLRSREMAREVRDQSSQGMIVPVVGAYFFWRLEVSDQSSRGTIVPAASLAFELASIKLVPQPIPSGGGPWTVTNGQFKAEHAWIRGLVGRSHGVLPGQVKGGPDWIDQDRYDVDARAASSAAEPSQIMLMLQTLLKDRFNLAVHRETQQGQVYKLVLGKNGLKMQDANGGQTNYINWTGPEQVTFTANPNLSGLISILSSLLGSPVIDQTGISGSHNFSLSFRDPRDPRPRQSDSPPELITAVQEQLGLDLQATNGPVEIVVIDRIERLSEN